MASRARTLCDICAKGKPKLNFLFSGHAWKQKETFRRLQITCCELCVRRKVNSSSLPFLFLRCRFLFGQQTCDGSVCARARERERFLRLMFVCLRCSILNLIRTTRLRAYRYTHREREKKGKLRRWEREIVRSFIASCSLEISVPFFLPSFSQIYFYQVATDSLSPFFNLPARLFSLCRCLLFFLLLRSLSLPPSGCPASEDTDSPCGHEIVLRRVERAKEAMEIFYITPELNISEWSRSCGADFRSVLFHNRLPSYAFCASIRRTHWNIENVLSAKKRSLSFSLSVSCRQDAPSHSPYHRCSNEQFNRRSRQQHVYMVGICACSIVALPRLNQRMWVFFFFFFFFRSVDKSLLRLLWLKNQLLPYK